MRKRNNTIILVSALLFAVFLTACGNDENVKINTPVKVKVKKIIKVEVPFQYEYPGNVEGVRKAKLSTKLMGTLIYFPFEAGTKIQKGQILAKIKSAGLDAKREQVNANILQAKAAFNNIKINSDSSANLLYEKIKLLNDNPKIKFIIVRGNLTAHGYPDELDLVKSVFDSCKVPYYLLPGSNDIESSQSFGGDYKLTFGRTNFSFKKEGVFQIGIRGIKYELSNKAHFSPEEIKRLKKVIINIPINNLILLFLNHPLKYADNSWQIRNIFAGRKLLIVNPTDNTSYKILTVQNDSVYSTNNLLDSLSTNLEIEIKYFTQKDSTRFIDYSYLKKKRIPKTKANIIWQKNLQTETPNDILISKDKLFVVSKDGVIYCFDYEGNIKWTHNLDEIVTSKPVIINDVLIVATTEGDLLTLKAETGDVIQSIGIDDALVTSVLKTKINYYGQETDAVIVGGSSGTFYCYTLKKLELAWSNNFSDSEIVTKP